MINLLFADIPRENLGSLHFMVGLFSALLFLIWGGILIMSGSFNFRRLENPSAPKRNKSLRKMLGWCFLVISLSSIIISSYIYMHREEGAFYFPYTGLMLASAQVFLFTVAALVLFNSKRLKLSVVVPNFLPLVILPLFYMGLKDSGAALCVLGICFFSFYVMQLLLYTVMFFKESSKSLFYIEKFMDYDKDINEEGRLDIVMIYGISVLYLTSLAFGIWIFSNYYFSNVSSDLTFILSFTICYFIIGWYYTH